MSHRQGPVVITWGSDRLLPVGLRGPCTVSGTDWWALAESGPLPRCRRCLGSPAWRTCLRCTDEEPGARPGLANVEEDRILLSFQTPRLPASPLSLEESGLGWSGESLWGKVPLAALRISSAFSSELARPAPRGQPCSVAFGPSSYWFWRSAQSREFRVLPGL